MTTPPVITCPVVIDAELASKSLAQAAAYIRQLVKDLGKCYQCQANGHCPIKTAYNTTIQTALAQVQIEMNLLPTNPQSKIENPKSKME